VSKALAFVLAATGFAASAHAADLSVDSLKDPLPDTLTWHGVTLYGTVDLGYGYQTHGAPLNGSVPQGLAYNIYGAKMANKPLSALDPSALERSGVGLKIEEAIGGGWVAVAKLETSFDPLSGQLSDGPASLLHNYGVPLGQQTYNSDSGRAGQAFNGPAYAGVSNATYGTLTVGRQQSPQLDAAGVYDPQGLAYAFSLLGWSSGLVGSGNTEAARWDNSVKYVYQYGPVHAAATYSGGGADTGIFGNAYGVDVGGTYKGFSLDAVYQRENSVVSASAASATTLKATISDNESWSVQGKYTYEFGGGFKDDAPGARLTFFGGYENISLANPSSNPSSYIGSTAIGGYLISTVASNPYTTDKVLQLAWTGARYELPSGWSFTGACYHVDQRAYTGTVSAPAAGTIQTKANSAGTANDASFVVDYKFNKHFDVYTGLNYSTLDGGLASGYLNNSQTSAVSGVRLKF
jgi:predicted porin